ncbi:MAG: hypothetical protein AMJ56_07620 [Anaerolineae bacterium SG8_19]|nr:MAG: hypothetical protein AMJ56_07620 [Anaerolineae bacterium SG8_19]
MDDRYISSPRPIWKEEETAENPSRRIMTLGSATSGIVIRITKKGVEFNGYYAGLQEPKKFANMREFIIVSWDDFDKLRNDVFRKEPLEKKNAPREPAAIDKKPDAKYLESLPQVTLNGEKYYVDMDRQERRPVSNPEKVFNFEKQAAKKPS